MIRGTTAERKPKAPASQEAGVFALSGLQAVITVIGALAGYVAPRSISPVGKPEARVATAQTNTHEMSTAGRLEDAGDEARA